MNHKILLFVSVMLFTKIFFAQTYDNDDKKFAFGFNIGKGKPMRDYGDVTMSQLPMSKFTGQDTTKISGYAQLGFHYDFYATYKLKRHFTIVFALYGDMNNYDLTVLNSQYAAFFPPNKVSVYTHREYHVMQYLIGPKFNLPVSKFCSVEFKALAGLTTNSYPPSLIYFGVKDTVISAYSSGKGFGYNFGVGLKYNLDMDGILGIGFHLNLNYAGSTLIYPSYVVVNSTSSVVPVYNFPKRMELGILQLTVGMSFELFPPKKTQ